MQELSMNILDIAQNSVAANATRLDITLLRDSGKNLLSLRIADNGKGMDAEMVGRVTDPFCTTRTTRKVGLGLPFLKMAAEMTGGAMSIDSTPGQGTAVEATFTADHIDLAPLGDMGSTVSVLCQANPELEVTFLYRVDGRNFQFDTLQIREVLQGVPLSEPSVAVWVRGYIQEGIQQVDAG